MKTAITESADGVVGQLISGPYQGYYVASYVLPVDKGYIAFAKVCQDQPRDVWQCTHVDRVVGLPATSPVAALDAVWLMACKVIERMPPPEYAVQDGADFFDAHTIQPLARIDPFLETQEPEVG